MRTRAGSEDREDAIMGKANKSGIRRGFGVDEQGWPLLPAKISNVILARLEHAADRGGCGYCFPHRFETTNATCKKNRRSWKNYRKTQYKVNSRPTMGTK